MKTTDTEAKASGPRLTPAAALLILAVIAYYPIFNAGFVWDDDAYVAANPTLRDFDGLERIWLEPTASPQYYPLVFSSFWIEYQLWELHPLGYHVINLTLHVLGGILLWRILRLLQVPAAWFVAAVFVLHPVQVESVAWISERKNVLSGFLYLAAALAYFRFSPPEQAPATVSGRWGWYVLSVGLFAGALLSKTVTCSLPAALLLVLWWKRPKLAWRDAAALAPFFALGIGLAFVTVWMEKYHVGAAKDWHLTPVERVLVAGRALWFYAAKLIWPTNLSFIYPRWEPDARAAWQYLFPAGALAVLIGLWLARRWLGKGPLVACLFFAGTLFPALGFIDVYPMRFSFVADHFQYLASIGLLAAYVAAGHALLRRAAPERPLVAPIVAATTLMVLTLLTWVQAENYTDLKTLWTATLEENPDCWMAHNNLGELLLNDKQNRRRLDEARRHFQEAIRLKPDDPYHHANLGKVFLEEGRYEEAGREFAESIRLDPESPDAHLKLGLALSGQNQFGAAIREYREAIRLRPNYAEAHNNLGVALFREKKPEEAIRHFLAAADAAPDDPVAYTNLVRAYALQGKLNQAIDYARRALETRPNDPRLRDMLESLLKEKEKPPERK